MQKYLQRASQVEPLAFIYSTRMMTQFDLFYHVYSKWLSCVNIISQLHVDILTSPSSCNYKACRHCVPRAIHKLYLLIVLMI